jgi:hypothetical protein
MNLVEQDVVEVPSRSNKKVPFYFLGEALFGAISLANNFWVDVHPPEYCNY